MGLPENRKNQSTQRKTSLSQLLQNLVPAKKLHIEIMDTQN